MCRQCMSPSGESEKDLAKVAREPCVTLPTYVDWSQERKTATLAKFLNKPDLAHGMAC